jgi:hypothetical protein
MSPEVDTSLRDKIVRDFLKRQNLSTHTEEHFAARVQTLRWLGQFEIAEQRFMLEVMKAMRIETKAAIDRAISKLSKAIVKALGNRHADAIFLGIGHSPASSGNHFLYPLLAELRVDMDRARTADELTDLIKHGCPIVLVDDIVGSGNQAIKYSKSILKARSQNIIYGCLYGLESGIENIQNNSHFSKVLVANLLKDKDCAFTSNSQIFPDTDLRKSIKRIATKYGKKIYPSGPIGYDDAGLLIAFPHNTPNNTLPIIWGGVESESLADHWEPLIARRKAPKAIPLLNGTLSKEELPPPKLQLPSKPEFYENLHPAESVRIVDVFVEPLYSIEINTDGGLQQGNARGFVNDAKEFLGKSDKILVISSPFGCGKTFLSKYLDLIGVLGNGERVVYVSAQSLKRILVKTENYEELFSNVEACIIDSVDELVIDDLDAEQILGQLCKCLTAARRVGTKVVLNLRVSDANHNENRTINLIFENLYAEGADLRLPVLRIRGFDKEQIVEWLSNYQANDIDQPMTFGSIEEIHKRLGYAAGNPLFLYQLASFYKLRGRLDSIYTVYQIYDVFVDSTTTGRYEPSGSLKRPHAWRFASLYSVFLEHVACAINNSRHYRKQIQSHQDENVDWRLDANEMTHSISEEELSQSTEKDYQRFIVHDGDAEKKIRDDRLELLNNYFFTRNERLIGFKDNNILFFLVAKRLFRAIAGLVNDGEDKLSSHLNAIAETKGHPQAIEILLKRVKTEGDIFRSALSRRIDELIKSNRIIQLTSESLERLTGESINRDIILSIVLLHVKRGSYDQLDYFMTRLSWLTSAVKFHDSSYRKLISRFFRNIQLREVEFRRLNCDDYNFQGTEFNKVKFIQCKLFSPIFDETKHSDTVFSLCDFGGHSDVAKFSHITGSISFNLCRVGRLVISQDAESAAIELHRCEIDELHIEATNANLASKIDLSIKGSKIGKVFLVNTYLGTCEVQDSHVEYVSDKNSKGTINYSFFRPVSEIRIGKQTGKVRISESS